jgi:hypothetical protein
MKNASKPRWRHIPSMDQKGTFEFVIPQPDYLYYYTLIFNHNFHPKFMFYTPILTITNIVKGICDSYFITKIHLIHFYIHFRVE